MTPVEIRNGNALRPLRRLASLSVQQVGQGPSQETLVYDELCHKAFCLNPLAAAVWAGCDGSRTLQQIAADASAGLGTAVAVDAVELAVAQLQADNLLVEAAIPAAAMAGMSRRRMMAGVGAGAALLVPAIAVVMAPKAAQAYGGCFDCANTSPAAMRRARQAAAAAKAEQDRQRQSSLQTEQKQ